MKVYGMAASSVTQKVLTVFAEKDHEYELVEVNILKGEDKLPEHLSRQPFGEIPVVEDDGFWLYESRAIIRYLDQRLPGPALTPPGVRERALMEQWISVEQSYFSGPVWRIVQSGPVYDAVQRAADPELFPPRPDAAAVAEAKAQVGHTLDVVEEALSKQPYLAGPAFSLAEVSWMPYVSYLIASGGGDLVKARPHVAAWWDVITARPSWLRVGRIFGAAG